MKSLFEEEKPWSGSKTQNTLAQLNKLPKGKGGPSLAFSCPGNSPFLSLCVSSLLLSAFCFNFLGQLYIQPEPSPQRAESIDLNLKNRRVFFISPVRKISGKIVSWVNHYGWDRRESIWTYLWTALVRVRLYSQKAKVSYLKVPTGNYMIYGKTSDPPKRALTIRTDKRFNKQKLFSL